MLIAYLISLISRIFLPQNVVLINQKLGGFWEVTYDNLDPHPEGLTRVIKFDKCKKADRKNKVCNLTWMYVESSSIYKRKLDKSIKKSWEPVHAQNYWVDKKRDKETKLPVIHVDNFNFIAINLIKKKYDILVDSVVFQSARKLK